MHVGPSEHLISRKGCRVLGRQPTVRTSNSGQLRMFVPKGFLRSAGGSSCRPLTNAPITARSSSVGKLSAGVSSASHTCRARLNTYHAVIALKAKYFTAASASAGYPESRSRCSAQSEPVPRG